MNEQTNSNTYNSNDIDELIKRIEQLEIENQRVNNELETLKKKVNQEQIDRAIKVKQVERKQQPSRITQSENYLNIPTENRSSSVRARLSKKERESRSILPLSGKVATDHIGRRIKIGDRVKSKTIGEFSSRYGVVVNIGSDKSDRIFFKDEDKYIQNRAAKNLIIQDS